MNGKRIAGGRVAFTLIEPLGVLALETVMLRDHRHAGEALQGFGQYRVILLQS